MDEDSDIKLVKISSRINPYIKDVQDETTSFVATPKICRKTCSVKLSSTKRVCQLIRNSQKEIRSNRLNQKLGWENFECKNVVNSISKFAKPTNSPRRRKANSSIRPSFIQRKLSAFDK